MNKSKTNKNPAKKKKNVDLSSGIMSTIKKEHITMKPKAYFVAGSLILGGGLALAVAMALMFFAVGSFHLRTTNPAGFLRYGSLGGPIFLHIFPWKPLLVAIGSIISGLFLLKRYDISYKKSFSSIAIAFIGAAIVFGIGIDRMGINDRLKKSQITKGLYSQKLIKQNMVVGEIVASDSSNSAIFIQEPRSGREVKVVWDEETILPNGSDFKIGDKIGGIGTLSDDTFYAHGIHIGDMRWQETPRPRSLDDSFPRRPMMQKKFK